MRVFGFRQGLVSLSAIAAAIAPLPGGGVTAALEGAALASTSSQPSNDANVQLGNTTASSTASNTSDPNVAFFALAQSITNSGVFTARDADAASQGARIGSGPDNFLAQGAFYSAFPNGQDIRADAANDPIGSMWSIRERGTTDLASYSAAQSELISNTSFTSNITGWTSFEGTASWASGTLQLYNWDDGEFYYPSSVSTSVSGAAHGLYRIDITVTTLDDTTYIGINGGGNYMQINSAGTYTQYFYSENAITSLSITGVAQIDSISLKRCGSSCRLSNSGTTDRPLRRNATASGYVDFDGANDVLRVYPNSATTWGSSCTVYTRTQAGAHAWLTGQTMPVTGTRYAMPTTDWVKAFICDRALTAGEQAIVEAWGAA